MRQTEITVLKDFFTEFRLASLIRDLPFITDTLSVPALAGKTADHDQRRIRKLCRTVKKLCRNGRFHGHPRNSSAGVLLLYIFPVKICQRLINLSQSSLLCKTVIKISHMRNRHIAASATSFYIIKNAFAKKCQSGAFCQRKKLPCIFQKHHAFRSGFSRQSQMLRTGCHLSAVSSQWKIRLIVCSCPFFHCCDSSL